MIQFHETGYGRAFFSGQLPALIKQIKRVADALEAQNKLAKEAVEERKRQEPSSVATFFSEDTRR